MNQELRELLEKLMAFIDEIHCDQSCACGKCRELRDQIQHQLETNGWQPLPEPPKGEE